MLMGASPAAAQDAFITTWETTEPGEAITIPTRGGEEAPDYAFTINWGDGTTSEAANEPVPHATAQTVVNEIRADISSKAQFSQHFETVDTANGTRFKPSTATAHAVLATLPQDTPSQ
jgi:hypothetical protein